MKRLISLVLVIVISCFCYKLCAQKKGEVIFRADFDKKDKRWDRSGAKEKFVKKDGVGAVRIKAGLMKINLPVETIRGTKVALSVRLRAENVSQPPNSWNGIKAMIYTALPWDNSYQQIPLYTGSYDWREAGYVTFIPAEAEAVWLFLGLENVSGQVWFDYVEVKITEEARKLPTEKLSGVLFKGHDRARLRGMMVTTDIAEEDLRDLAGWGANLIRWQMAWGGFPYSPLDTLGPEAYLEWIDSRLKYLDQLLPVCRELDVKVVIDLHTPPGGKDRSSMTSKMFLNSEWQNVFRETWKKIATRYKEESAIWGYDLANEPEEGLLPDGVLDWYQLATVTSQDIRAIDSAHAIIIEAAPRGGPEALARMEPIPVEGIVYSFHMYVPATFTHQGLDADPPSVIYPGTHYGRYWDIESLRKVLAPVRKWQEDYNAHIYVGEFSAIRWAPGQSAFNYLRDCITIFEEMGWDWSYHAFREYHGWSVEHTEDKTDETPAKEPTERQKLLMKYFQKNKE